MNTIQGRIQFEGKIYLRKYGMRIFSRVYMDMLEIFVGPKFSAMGMGAKNWLCLSLASTCLP